MKSWRVMTALALAAVPLAAQTPAPTPAPGAHWPRTVAHYGKWATLVSAIAFTAAGAHEHHYSQIEWNQLLDICRANNADCMLGADGRYLNQNAELLYQASLHFDRRAQRWLLGAQAAVVTSAVLFVYDITRHSEGPQNIPLHPLQVTLDRATDGAARVGLRLTF